MNFRNLTPLLGLICVALGIISCTNKPAQNESRSWSDVERSQLVDGLSNTLDSLLGLVSGLSEEEWKLRIDSNDWNIGQIVTHLSIHDALFYRELRATTALPIPTSISDSLLDSDEFIMKYAVRTPENMGTAPWYLEPDQRWLDREQTIRGFTLGRRNYVSFIQDTQVNLRRYYTPNGRGLKPYRDLHQLVLISISHTRRHLIQIELLLEKNKKQSNIIH